MLERAQARPRTLVAFRLVTFYALVTSQGAGSTDIRRAEEVRDVLIVPVVKERLVLVALTHSLIRVVLFNLVDTSLQRLLELGWRG